LYIRAWKSFAINQYLYIQNRNPFAINESFIFAHRELYTPLDRPNAQPNPIRPKADQASRNPFQAAPERFAV
jgi:hypothetical protein